MQARGVLHRPDPARVWRGTGRRSERAVPGDPGFEIRIGLAGVPHHLAAPAEPGDRHLAHVGPGLAFEELQRRADIAHHLRVAGGGDDLDDRGEVGQRRRVAGAVEEARRDRHVAQLCDPAADVQDVGVQAEHLVDDQHHRKAPRSLRASDITADRTA